VAEWLRSGLQSRLHRFDSGRRLLIRDPFHIRHYVGLAALCAALVIVPGCGGDDNGGDEDPAALRSQDAQAKSDARNLVSNVEACYAEQGTYDLCGTAESLGETGLPIGSDPGQVEVVNAGSQSYEAVGHSKSGTDFKIAKAADGSVGRSCDSPDKGGCMADGRW
jgi:hypothetical protein